MYCLQGGFGHFQSSRENKENIFIQNTEELFNSRQSQNKQFEVVLISLKGTCYMRLLSLRMF